MLISCFSNSETNAVNKTRSQNVVNFLADKTKYILKTRSQNSGQNRLVTVREECLSNLIPGHGIT